MAVVRDGKKTVMWARRTHPTEAPHGKGYVMIISDRKGSSTSNVCSYLCVELMTSKGAHSKRRPFAIGQCSWWFHHDVMGRHCRIEWSTSSFLGLSLLPHIVDSIRALAAHSHPWTCSLTWSRIVNKSVYRARLVPSGSFLECVFCILL